MQSFPLIVTLHLVPHLHSFTCYYASKATSRGTFFRFAYIIYYILLILEVTLEHTSVLSTSYQWHIYDFDMI